MNTRGADMYALCEQLYPVLRSITGAGVRRTLDALQEHIDLQVHEVPSGTQVFDWTVPPEWNVRAACIRGPDGEKIVDLAEHSLHLVSYSEPMRARMPLQELQKHLHSLPDHPTWIPYRTSYYTRTWGFCLEHAKRESLPDGEYDVLIDSSLEDGALTYGECVVPGVDSREILISTHICHPSLANDNLSGIAVATALARDLRDSGRKLRYTYRFLFVPGTIGAIAWLARNEHRFADIAGGLVLSGVGDRGPLTYKRSRIGDSDVDRVFERALRSRGAPHTVTPFHPYGYDERQFCSPGVNLAVGCLMRTPYGTYPQYHTSADDLDFICPESLEDTVRLCAEAFAELEHVRKFRNPDGRCEPQLGRRGLYESVGGENDRREAQTAMLWMLSYSDGAHSTLDIAELSGLSARTLDEAAARLCDAQLLQPE